MNTIYNDAEPRSIFSSVTGFTMTELVIVIVIIGILSSLAHSALRTPNEKMACKNIYSAMQLAKLRAIATAYSVYVDFDEGAAGVGGNFFTVYVDTDNNNALTNSTETTESQFVMADASGGVTGANLPANAVFGIPNPNPATAPGSQTLPFPPDGVDFNGANEVTFTSRGTATNGGSVYVYDKKNTSKICAVEVLTTGIIRMWTWNGNNWN